MKLIPSDSIVKYHFIPAISCLLFLFSGCDNKDRTINLDILNIYNVGDTLIYNNQNAKDTFIMTKKSVRTIYSDKKNIEILDIRIPELNMNCDPYCDGMEIQGSYNSSYLNFRNYSHSIDLRYTWDSMVNYTIGSRTINNVYKLSSYDTLVDIKDLKTIFYTLRNGVIAYELIAGDVFELDEMYVK